MRARDVMSHPVLTVPPTLGVKQAADLLSRKGYTAMPVVDVDQQVIGMVTEADLVRDRFPHDPRYRSPDDDQRAELPATVGDLMTEPADVRPSSTDIADLARSMVEDHRRCFPIVDNGQLVGIVTRRDLLRVLRRSDLDIATDVRRHLAIFGPQGRYAVSVRDGEAVVTDQFDDAGDRHVAQVIAEAVPGVIRARVQHASQ